MKALFTIVPVGGIFETVNKTSKVIEEESPFVCKSDFIKILKICIKFGVFLFNGEDYCQHESLTMGSPLRAVMPSLFMELLQRQHYLHPWPRKALWGWYIEDILVVSHANTNITNLLQRLTRVADKFQLEVESECEG